MLYSLLSGLDKLMPFETVSGHCDIPCKIYDPISAQLNVLTMIRLIDLIEPLTQAESLSAGKIVQLTRLTSQKELHGAQLKEDVRVIWGDYFKQPQLEKFPETHALVHSIMLQASKVKQEINRGDAVKLLDLVNQFAAIFWATKDVETHTATCPYPPAEQVVYPVLKA